MRLNGIDLTPFTPRQRIIISTIALANPGRVSRADIAVMVWPNADDEPQWAESIIAQTMVVIRRAWTNPNWHIQVHQGTPGGYSLEPGARP